MNSSDTAESVQTLLVLNALESLVELRGSQMLYSQSIQSSMGKDSEYAHLTIIAIHRVN
ncbi:MAG: hypothetical protein WAM88_05395 [Nitrososphaeraceae archaeon]